MACQGCANIDTRSGFGPCAHKHARTHARTHTLGTCRMRASAFVCVSPCASEWHSHRRVEKVMVGMVVLALVVLQDLSAQPVHPPLAGPGAYLAGVRPVPVQMWQGCAQSRCRCAAYTEPISTNRSAQRIGVCREKAKLATMPVRRGEAHSDQHRIQTLHAAACCRCH
jgi:hypothetical protein